MSLPESIGPLITWVRQARGQSQLRVAELLCSAAGTPTLTRHEISRWEREERIPAGFWLCWLAVVFDLPLPVLEAAAAHARQRRAPGGPLTTGDGPIRPATRLVGPIEDDRDRLATLRRMDDLVGSADLLDRALSELARLAQPVTTTSARGSLDTLAATAQLASWIAADAGDPATARRAARLALRTAHTLGDRQLIAYTVGGLAEVAAERRPHSRALSVASAAAEQALGTASATGRALLLHRVAFTAARTGQRRQCEQALTDADRAFARRVPDRDPPWLYWLDDAHMTALTGRCYAALGQPRLARPLLAEAIRDGVPTPRGQALLGAWLGLAHLAAGDLDAACAAAGRALLAAIRVGSPRACHRVGRLDAALRRRRGTPVVRDYLDRVAAAIRYLPGRTVERSDHGLASTS